MAFHDKIFHTILKVIFGIYFDKFVQIFFCKLIDFILVTDGDTCRPNPCGPYSGCRVVQSQTVCFCLPEYVGNPPSEPCHTPANPCSPSPCGPHTSCHVVGGYHRCTCLEGFVGNPNTIIGCQPPPDPCVPNPCGTGARCNKDLNPQCVCPPGTVGNPFDKCVSKYPPRHNSANSPYTYQ